MSTQTIPVVSLQDYLHGTTAAREQFVATLGDALTDIGFFALEEHGVQQQLIDDAYECAQSFFELPEEVKNEYIIPGGRGQRAFTRYGMEHAKDHPSPDMKEFWQVGRDLSADNPMFDLKRQNRWPNEVARFQTVMERLYDALDDVARSLLQACALYIGESQNLLADMAEGGDTILRLIHYPPVPETRDPAAVRAAAHEDINLLTILCEATSGGLELQQRDGSWRQIHALNGQFVVDSGDMIQHCTNGLFRSTTHRVVNPNNNRERRFSMPFFVHPRAEVDLTPLKSCIQRTGGKAKFNPLNAHEFLQMRLAEIGLGEH